jgi:hypothetical protein
VKFVLGGKLDIWILFLDILKDFITRVYMQLKNIVLVVKLAFLLEILERSGFLARNWNWRVEGGVADY